MNTCFSIIFGVAIYFIAKNAQENGGPAGWRVINYFLGVSGEHPNKLSTLFAAAYSLSRP